MSFAFKRKDVPADDLTWLGSKHAVGDARTITLDGSAFATFEDAGIIPSGIALTQAGEKFVPATSASDVAGFLLSQQMFDGSDVVAPMLDHGRVIAAKLPEQAVDGAAISSPHFIVVGGTAADNGGAEGND